MLTFCVYPFVGFGFIANFAESAAEHVACTIESSASNTYQIIRHGRHKLLHQTPWYDADGTLGGLIELAIDLPRQNARFQPRRVRFRRESFVLQ